MKKQHAFISAIAEKLREQMYEVVSEGYYPRETDYELETDAGTITVLVDRNDDVRATVWHDGTQEEHDCPIIADAVYNELPLWSDVEEDLKEASMDIWQRNGFASEADFWNWKEGRRY